MDIIEKIREFLLSDSEYNFSEDMTDDDNLIENGVITSLTVIKLVVFLEETYNISFEYEELNEETVESLKNIEQLVLDKMNCEPATLFQGPCAIIALNWSCSLNSRNSSML